MGTSITITNAIPTSDSIELWITSMGSNLVDWEYNLYWRHPDQWETCTLTPTQEGYSRLVINDNIDMCTVYGVTVRAKIEGSSQYVTSEGHTNLKTLGYAVLGSVTDFVIGEDEKIKWKWKIENTSYKYHVFIANDMDDLILEILDDISVSDAGENVESESNSLEDWQMEALYALEGGTYKVIAVTKDMYGNILADTESTITVRLTEDGSKLLPEFTEFTISPQGEILKGYTTVVIDYRYQAQAKYGATMSSYHTSITDAQGTEVASLDDGGCVGLVEWVPSIAGEFAITVIGIDTRGRGAQVAKTITVTDYEPIEVTNAIATRHNGGNNIDLNITGHSSKLPTIKYNYTLPSATSWSLQDDFPVAGACIKTENGFKYINQAFAVGSSDDIIVKLVISDEVTAVELMLYIPSSKIISITTEKDANNAILGKIKLNGQGMMGYVGEGNADATLEGGIYETTFNGNRGFLEVISSPSTVMQRLTVYDSDDVNRYDVWLRFYVNSSFTEWKQIY